MTRNGGSCGEPIGKTPVSTFRSRARRRRSDVRSASSACGSASDTSEDSAAEPVSFDVVASGCSSDESVEAPSAFTTLVVPSSTSVDVPLRLPAPSSSLTLAPSMNSSGM